MTELPIQALLLQALEVVERLGLPYMVMGGFAVRTWGVPRPTYDADLAVAFEEDDLPRLLAGLERAGFEVPDEHAAGFRDRVASLEKVKVTRFVDGSVWDVDIFMARGQFFSRALPRRRRRSLEGREVDVMAPEDVIALKLLAFRRKDQLDVEEILKITPDVELAHLRAQVDLLGVRDRLAEFLPDTY